MVHERPPWFSVAITLGSMADASLDLIAINERMTTSNFSVGDAASWMDESCYECAAPRMLVVMRSGTRNQAFLRCPVCLAGAVWVDGEVKPRSSGLIDPKSQPPEDQYVWDEIRNCMSVSAYSAVVMLCRKLLLHLAVQAGLPPKNERDRAPTFEQALDHLVSEGYVTVRMRPWVDKLRSVGNESNHELPQVTKAQAEMVARFTQQLLVMTYEYPNELETETDPPG